MIKGILFVLVLFTSLNGYSTETAEIESSGQTKECIEYWYLDSVV